MIYHAPWKFFLKFLLNLTFSFPPWYEYSGFDVIGLAALLAGGNWSNGTNCGSRARNANNSRLNVNANYGCQGQARIRGRREATPAERHGHVGNSPAKYKTEERPD